MLTQAQKNQLIKKFEGLGFPESLKQEIPRVLEESGWDEEIAIAMLSSVDAVTDEQEKQIRNILQEQKNPPKSSNPQQFQQFGNQMTYEQQQQMLLQMQKIQQLEEEQQKFAIQESLNKQDDKPITERMRLQGIPVGLQNFGNTCYFNCILQIIFANPTLTEVIMNFRPQKAETPIIKAQEKFLLELQLLISRLMITNEKYKKPEEVYKAAQALQKIVAKKQQGEFQVGNFYDVSEYFDTILQLIDQSLSRRVEDRLNSQTIFEDRILNQEYCSLRSIADRDEYAVQFHFYARDQFIYQSFLETINQQGKFKSLPNNIVITLSRYVEDKQKQEQEYWFSPKLYLDFIMGNQAANERIQQYVIQSQSNEEITLSNKLQREILAFERIIKHYENKQIVSTDVVHSLNVELGDMKEQSKKYFPKNIEDLNFDLKVNSQFAYYLHIIVIHVGSAATGHYYMYIHNFLQNKWFKFNDYNVTIETDEIVMNDARKNGNILFYVNQEQRAKVVQYETELREIEQKLFQLGENLKKIDQSSMKVLSWIPPKFQEKLLDKENQAFQKEYDDEQAIIEKSKQVR